MLNIAPPCLTSRPYRADSRIYWGSKCLPGFPQHPCYITISFGKIGSCISFLLEIGDCINNRHVTMSCRQIGMAVAEAVCNMYMAYDSCLVHLLYLVHVPFVEPFCELLFVLSLFSLVIPFPQSKVLCVERS